MRTPFAEQLARHAADAGAPPAIVLPSAEISYAELRRRVEHCAAWMRAEGCGPDDVVGITIADEIAHLTVSLASFTLGIAQVCLPTFEPAAPRAKLARALDVTRVIAVERDHALPGIAASFVAPAALAQPRDVPTQEALRVEPDAPMLFIASSGSTGEPKLIAMTTRVLGKRLGLRGYPPGERALTLTTVEDVFGKTPRLYCAWLGRTSVFRTSAAGTPVFALAAFCATHRVTRLSVGVLHASTLVLDDVAPLPAGLNVYTGGARVPMRLREAFRARGGARLHVEYGAREVGLIAATWPHDRDPSLESVGPVAEHAAVESSMPRAACFPPARSATVRVRTASMIDGYHRNPRRPRAISATAGSTRRPGRFSPRGSLCLVGRIDDVMNLTASRSTRPRSSACSSAIRRSGRPRRSRCARSSTARSRSRRRVAGDARPEAAALLSRVRAELGVRAPRRIVVVDALPRTSHRQGRAARAPAPRHGEAMKQLVVALAVALAGFAPLAEAQDAAPYPNRPIRLVLPHSPGNGDIVPRLFADRLAAKLGQPIVFENRPGASFNIASEVAAKAPADGYTLLYSTSAVTLLPQILGPTAVDPVASFAPIAKVLTIPVIIVVNPTFGRDR
jgi:acyl-coenzyme A synthetase/AMP-(fatty) acid ligase